MFNAELLSLLINAVCKEDLQVYSYNETRMSCAEYYTNCSLEKPGTERLRIAYCKAYAKTVPGLKYKNEMGWETD
jgi:hypothetical protein